MSENLTKSLNHRYISNPKKHHIRILFYLSEGYIEKDIAKKMSKSIPTVCEHIANLEFSGYVEPKVVSSIKTYKLTQKGLDYLSSFLRGYDNKPNFILVDRSHNIKLKCKILIEPRNFDKVLIENQWIRSREKEDFNWNGYFKRFGDVLMFKTTKHFLFQLPIMYFKSSDEALLEAGRMVERLISTLENEYKGLRLGGLEKVSYIVSQSHALPNDAFALFCKKNNFCYNDDRISVDASKTPELEFVDAKYSAEDFMKYIDLIRGYLDGKIPLELLPSVIKKVIALDERISIVENKLR